MTNLLSSEELRRIESASRLAANIRNSLVGETKVGATTKQIDEIAGQMLKDAGAESAPIKDYDFPGNICISINDEVAHGIPSDREIADGDIVNIDVSLCFDGLYADTGCTVIAGEPLKKQHKRMIDANKTALDIAIASVKPGEKFNKIGRKIQQHAAKTGFKIIRNLCGHGIGKSLHEEPQHILSFYEPAFDDLIEEGMTFTIEPMFSISDEQAIKKSDNWQLYTANGSVSSQFEHTILVTSSGAEILTA